MQNNSTLSRFVSGFLYSIFGNVLSLIMFFSTARFMSGNFGVFIRIFVIAASAAIYFLLCFQPAFKDGVRDREKLKLKRIDEVNNKKWILPSALVWAASCLPLAAFFVYLPNGNMLWLNIFRFLSGAYYPLSLLFPEGIFVVVFDVVFYGLCMAAMLFGYRAGLNNLFDPDKIMYKD